MWVLVRTKKSLTTKYFKHKLIRFYLYILINKLKKYEVKTIKE